MRYETLTQQIIEIIEKGSMTPTVQSTLQDSKGMGAILYYLCYCHDGVSATELAEFLHVNASRVANALKVLEQKQLLRRCVNVQDRRKILVYVTEAGRQSMQHKRRELADYIESIIERFGERDMTTLLALLGKLNVVLDNVNGQTAAI